MSMRLKLTTRLPLTARLVAGLPSYAEGELVTVVVRRLPEPPATPAEPVVEAQEEC